MCECVCPVLPAHHLPCRTSHSVLMCNNTQHIYKKYLVVPVSWIHSRKLLIGVTFRGVCDTRRVVQAARARFCISRRAMPEFIYRWLAGYIHYGKALSCILSILHWNVTSSDMCNVSTLAATAHRKSCTSKLFVIDVGPVQKVFHNYNRNTAIDAAAW